MYRYRGKGAGLIGGEVRGGGYTTIEPEEIVRGGERGG